jgi:hypothetical protein
MQRLLRLRLIYVTSWSSVTFSSHHGGLRRCFSPHSSFFPIAFRENLNIFIRIGSGRNKLEKSLGNFEGRIQKRCCFLPWAFSGLFFNLTQQLQRFPAPDFIPFPL